MKYESPELDVIELDAVDVIQTSGITIPGTGTGNENELPFNPAKAASPNMDDTYNN